MTSKPWLAFLAPVALTAALASGGCGQDVPSCSSVCAMPGAPSTCETSCNAAETACVAASCSADVQAYLTCMGNAGTYTAINGLCAPIAKALGAESGVTQGASTGASGDASVTSASCVVATCASVCATESGSSVASCAQGCTVTQETCSQAASEFQALLTCICDAGGYNGSTNVGSQCASALASLAGACPAIVTTGSGGSTGSGTSIGGSSGGGVPNGSGTGGNGVVIGAPTVDAGS